MGTCTQARKMRRNENMLGSGGGTWWVLGGGVGGNNEMTITRVTNNNNANAKNDCSLPFQIHFVHRRMYIYNQPRHTSDLLHSL